MVRLDDNELNIHPEIAAALEHLRPGFVEEAVEPRIRTERSDVAEDLFVGFREGAEVFVRILLWIFGAAVLYVAALLVFVIVGWLYVLFSTTPQQGQLGASRAPGLATVAHPQTYRPPRRARQQHPRHRTTTSLHLSAHRKISRPKSAYLPPTVDASAIRKIKSISFVGFPESAPFKGAEKPPAARRDNVNPQTASHTAAVSVAVWLAEKENGHEPVPTQ